MKRISLWMCIVTALCLPGCATKNQVRQDVVPAAENSAGAATAQRDGGSRPGPATGDGAKITAEEVLPAAVTVAPPGEITEDAAVPMLKTIYFDFDSWLLSPETRTTIAENARWLTSNKDVRVVLEGHTDERGSDAYNLALGENRAKAVHDYLGRLGVGRERLTVVSYGEEKPAVEADNEEGWRMNRRVEFRVKK